MNLMLMLIITTLISLILMLVSFWLPQMMPDMEKLSPYESRGSSAAAAGGSIS